MNLISFNFRCPRFSIWRAFSMRALKKYLNFVQVFNYKYIDHCLKYLFIKFFHSSYFYETIILIYHIVMYLQEVFIQINNKIISIIIASSKEKFILFTNKIFYSNEPQPLLIIGIWYHFAPFGPMPWNLLILMR